MVTKVVDKRYFLAVNWCNKVKRGIFCSKTGIPFSQNHPFTEEESWNILGPFNLILNPQSLELTEEELKTYRKWYPLAEYSNEFGVAYKSEPAITITGKIEDTGTELQPPLVSTEALEVDSSEPKGPSGSEPTEFIEFPRS